MTKNIQWSPRLTVSQLNIFKFHPYIPELIWQNNIPMLLYKTKIYKKQ